MGRATIARKTDAAAPTVPFQHTTHAPGRTPSRILIVVITAIVLYFSCAGWPPQSGFQVALVASDLGFLLAMILLWRR